MGWLLWIRSSPWSRKPRESSPGLPSVAGERWTPGVQVLLTKLCAQQGTLVNTLQEVKPTAFLGVPRIWEKMHEKIKETVDKSSSLRRKVFLWARNIGFKVNSKRMPG